MPRSLAIKIIFAIAFLAALALGGYAFWKNAGNRGAEDINKTAVAPESKPESNNPALLSDSDSDGLPDWEEKLWQTDPNNRDSDKDGTSDGDEIARNRDPRKKGPDDALQFSIERTNQNAQSAPRVSLPTSGNSSIGNTVQSQPTAPQLTESSLQPSQTQTQPQTPDASQIAFKAYGNKAGEALLPYAQKWQKELNSFTAAIKETAKEKEEAEKMLREVAEEYRARANALTTISPPAELAPLHKDLIKKYENQAKNIELIAGAAGSGVSGEQWKIYNAAVEAAGKAFVAVSQFFKERGISFSQNEGGVLFNMPSQ